MFNAHDKRDVRRFLIRGTLIPMRVASMIALGIVFGILLFLWKGQKNYWNTSPIPVVIARPLDQYTIDALGNRSFTASQVTYDEAIATTSAYTVYQFHFYSDGKKVTGLVHVPTGSPPAGGFPMIVQFRGYVDRETYTPGMGTMHSAEVFASNGFIALAPDFLGYGGSDMPSEDIFEERFQTYTTALTLLSSIGNVPKANAGSVGIWGHSNGGQIALTVLEVTGRPIPTVLWAPVSKPITYSILYYTDEAADRGKFLRKKLAEFEEDYDADLYSVPQYLDRISAPLEIHQGTADDAVPLAWSDELAGLLKDKGKDVTYFTYPGADHNLTSQSDAWTTAMNRSISFFREKLLGRND